jgi:hypothetical protein
MIGDVDADPDSRAPADDAAVGEFVARCAADEEAIAWLAQWIRRPASERSVVEPPDQPDG